MKIIKTGGLNEKYHRTKIPEFKVLKMLNFQEGMAELQNSNAVKRMKSFEASKKQIHYAAYS